MDLKTALFDIMDICFKGGGKKFITVGNYCARWVNKEKQRSVVFFTIFTKKGFEVLTEFSTCKQNIQTVYWDSYAIRSSTIFC